MCLITSGSFLSILFRCLLTSSLQVLLSVFLMNFFSCIFIISLLLFLPFPPPGTFIGQIGTEIAPKLKLPTWTAQTGGFLYRMTWACPTGWPLTPTRLSSAGWMQVTQSPGPDSWGWSSAFFFFFYQTIIVTHCELRQPMCLAYLLRGRGHKTTVFLPCTKIAAYFCSEMYCFCRLDAVQGEFSIF